MIRRTLDALYDAAGAAAGLCVFSIFAVMLIAAGARELGFRTGGTDDLVSWMTAAAAFLGLAHTFKHGDFVRVGLFLEKMPPRLRRGFELASLSIGVIFTGFLLWSVALYLYNGWLEPEATVTELLVLADRYDLAELKETCASSLKSSITEQNCLEVSCLLLRVADPERFDQDPTFDVDAEPDPNFTCCR